MSWNNEVPFAALVGKTLADVTSVAKGDDRITFTTTDGESFLMHHSQDCCESVSIDDIEGDLADLIGSPIVLAEESSNSDPMPGQEVDNYYSFTWTFYRIATAKGFVVIRWYGESNGYYSESVDFEVVKS